MRKAGYNGSRRDVLRKSMASLYRYTVLKASERSSQVESCVRIIAKGPIASHFVRFSKSN